MKLLVAFLILIVLYFGVRLSVAWISSTPSIGGREDDRLGPCPSTPNCVNSADADIEHAIDALQLEQDTTTNDVANILLQMPGVQIEQLTENYLHATIRTRFWGFIDDLEVSSVNGTSRFEIRSASRLGVSDLGANRKRVEKLRTLLQAKR